ncbi:hypothetical protein [Lactovum miscens]|uniref:Uncharacterized protein n=1 Tax=Lactovum miscens TaxID=190387 RepID=A0A841C5F6_9LACT|nr:hypothetical protein [Lactovum miscens]MBB5887584.1 hypothetical protein [Lactovum miscens]
MEYYVKIDNKSIKKRIALGLLGVVKLAILVGVLSQFLRPLLLDFKAKGFQINGLSGFAIILWFQQMIDCISGILSSQLKTI